MIKKISILGSGNMATQLSLAFLKTNIQIDQIISRNKQTGKLLAKQINTTFSDNINSLKNPDLIIMCVNDDSIKSLAKKLPNIPVVHTSGNTSINIFHNKTDCGVLYPIQSLNKEITIKFTHIPICIEGNNPVFEKKIFNLTQKISKTVLCLTSEKRKHLHLSAVIASNFSNFCYLIAKKHLDEQQLPFSLLIPLIIETAQKIEHQDPLLSQTGPAKRGDKQVISEHLKILKNENYKKIYKLLSKNILKEYEK